LRLLLATILFLLAGTASAQTVRNPTDSSTPCPDGSKRIVWIYPPDAGIPGNATSIACDAPGGCTASPASACLKMLDKEQPLGEQGPPPVHGDPPTNPSLSDLPDLPAVPPSVGAFRPSAPVDGTALPQPATVCSAGTGWDFEDVLTPDQTGVPAWIATMQGWIGDFLPDSPFGNTKNVDLDLRAAPVYGNAAPIDRIRPPGWVPDIEKQIGGDYWKFSQPVNAHGDFWISSRYRRYSWGQHPGDTWEETAVGTLTSPTCQLDANFVSFRMSGGQSTSQRVELLVQNAKPADYYGVRFPGFLGDHVAGSGHGTQFPNVPTVPQQFPPLAGLWTVVRSATSQDRNETDWMQVYAFDVRAFRGRKMRLRIVDDARSECVLFQNGVCKQMAVEHINADDFRFADAAPSMTNWFLYDERRCGFPGGDQNECSPVGNVASEPPLWGVTDVHAHPMANIGFGGHVVWGDMSDRLLDVYNCSHNLPAISGPGARDAITNSAESSACYVAGDIDAIVSGALLAGCSQLAVVPFVGIGIAGVCSYLVAEETAALLTLPVIEGLRLHGAEKMPSGAVNVGLPLIGVLAELDKLTLGQPLQSFNEGMLPSFDSWPNATPTVSWYDPTGEWHSFSGLGKSHNLYQVDMVRRAYEGGMRLGVWDVVSSRGLAFIADGKTYSDWQALKEETDAAKRIVATNLSDIATIVLTPEEAESVIRAGRMAVMLGSEVDELGRMRVDGREWPRSPHTPGDSMQKQVDDLWELGIRKITPVHSSNNPIGGPAIFTDQYVGNNHFLNRTDEDGDPSVLDLPEVNFVIDRTMIPTLPFQLLLAKIPFLQEVGAKSDPPWNPGGWFHLDMEPVVADKWVLTDPSNLQDQVTYRVGESKPKSYKTCKGVRIDDNTKKCADGNMPVVVTSMKDVDGSWRKPGDVFDKQFLVAQTIGPTMSTFIRPVGRCDLHNTVIPRNAYTFGDAIDAEFNTLSAHRNAFGLGHDGRTFLMAAMRRGMILDVDHMSQKMRIAAYQLAETFASESRQNSHTVCSEIHLVCGDYPYMGVHTTVRGLEKEGSPLPEFVFQFGSTDESTRTPSEIDYIAKNFGTVGVFPRGSAFIPPNYGGRCHADRDCQGWNPGVLLTDPHTCVAPTAGAPTTCLTRPGSPLLIRDFELPTEVANDCDTSSKTFAVKYLWLMKRMNGHGLALSTDLNGLIGSVNPRFGGATPGKDVCGGDKRGIPGETVLFGGWKALLPEAQRREHSGVWYTDYEASSVNSDRAAKWTDTYPSHKRWRQVVARGKGQLREDSAPRFTTMEEVVYYNAHGPVLPIHRWSDQTGNAPGAQMFPMVRWRNFESGWDFNLDGLQHIGLLPDLIQDMRNDGVQWEQLTPLFHGAQDYIDLWKRSVSIGKAHP
jgi:hypothetical protein